MPEDTQDNGRPPYREAMLALLRMADESMLHDSGNPVYHKMREDLNQFRSRSVQSRDHSEYEGTRTSRFDVPILGIRYGPGNTRRVYRVNRPRDQPQECMQQDADGRANEVDNLKTLVEITPDTKPSDSK